MTNKKTGSDLWWLGVGAGLAGSLIAWRFLQNKRRRPAWFEEVGPAGTALVTGASSGIGAEFSRRLADLGFDLLLVARREERLRTLAEEIGEENGVEVEVLVADLASEDGVARVEARMAGVDDLSLLVNNAGLGSGGPFVDAEMEHQLDMIRVHVLASVRLVRAALPGMIAGRRGGIINLASVAGFIPLPESAIYCGSKSFLVIFSEALAAELAGTGVRVQALCPGFTRTEFHDAPEFEETKNLIPGWLWMSACEVVSESLTALTRDQAVCIPGFKYRAMVAIADNPLVVPLRRKVLAHRKQGGHFG